MPYVNHRWLGGLLTNFQTINQRIRRLHDLERYEAEGQLALLPTRERMAAQADLEKLRANLGGVKNMQRVPDAMFVIDLKTEAIAVREAQRLRIPIIGLVDTNCDPDGIDFVIPGNDDAIRSCALITQAIGQVVAEGHSVFRAEEERARQEAEEKARAGGRGARQARGRRTGEARGRRAGASARPRQAAEGRAPRRRRSGCGARRSRHRAARHPPARRRRPAAPAAAGRRRRPPARRSAPAAAARAGSSRRARAAGSACRDARPAAEPAAEQAGEAERAAAESRRRHEHAAPSRLRRNRATDGDAASSHEQQSRYQRKDVKALRERTGAGMMDCKKALDRVRRATSRRRSSSCASSRARRSRTSASARRARAPSRRTFTPAQRSEC